MALPWSVLSGGQVPSTVHLIFDGAGFSAGAAAGSVALASLAADGAGDGAAGDDGVGAGAGEADWIGTGDGAGFCAAGAVVVTVVVVGDAGRGGSFSPEAARGGSTGAAIATGANVRSLLGRTGDLPLCPAQNAIAAPPSRTSTTA
jgi:hypothetical protein